MLTHKDLKDLLDGPEARKFLRWADEQNEIELRRRLEVLKLLRSGARVTVEPATTTKEKSC